MSQQTGGRQKVGPEKWRNGTTHPDIASDQISHIHKARKL